MKHLAPIVALVPTSPYLLLSATSKKNHNNFMLKDAINTFYTCVKINGKIYGQLRSLIPVNTLMGRSVVHRCLLTIFSQCP